MAKKRKRVMRAKKRPSRGAAAMGREMARRGQEYWSAFPEGSKAERAMRRAYSAARRGKAPKRKRNPASRGKLPVLYIRQNRAKPWVRVAVMASGPWAMAIGRRLHKTGLGVRVATED